MQSNVPNPPPSQKSDGNVYEMLWDCRFCGTKKLLGKTHRFCPNCGGQQDPSWRYFPADSEKIAVKDHVYVGADKICPACGSLSAANAEFCGNCGSPMDKAKAAQQGGNREKAEGATFDTEDIEEKRKKAQQATAQAAIAPKAQSGGGSTKWLIIGGVLIALVIAAVFIFTRTTNASVYVSGFRWERNIGVQALQAVPGSSDCNSMPVGSYNVDQRYEQVGSHQVPDGETCSVQQVDQGDGTFREERKCETNYRDEPDYGYVCYYVLNTWVNTRTSSAKGDKTEAPYWPDTNLSSGNLVGSEREGNRDEQYFLILKGDKDKTFECAVPFEQWQNTSVEQGFTIEVGAVLQNARCETLKPVG